MDGSASFPYMPVLVPMEFKNKLKLHLVLDSTYIANTALRK